MKKDFDLIVKKFPIETQQINIYPLGDVHVGSADFDVETFYKWKEMVLNDENGYVVMVGDMLENGTKRSKTNSYESTMRPSVQKQWLTEELRPIKDRILGVCRGNHEYRSVNEVDDCPLYDVMAKLDLEDLYRENMAFLKLNLGYKNKERQYSYTLVLAHGQSEKKTENFSYSIDGMDIFVTGHTHRPKSNFPAKIIIDSKNEIVKEVVYHHITVPSFARIGGYALRGMYLPQGYKTPVITLKGDRKGVELHWI